MIERIEAYPLGLDILIPYRNRLVALLMALGTQVIASITSLPGCTL